MPGQPGLLTPRLLYPPRGRLQDLQRFRRRQGPELADANAGPQGVGQERLPIPLLAVYAGGTASSSLSFGSNDRTAAMASMTAASAAANPTRSSTP